LKTADAPIDVAIWAVVNFAAARDRRGDRAAAGEIDRRIMMLHT